MTTFNWTSLPTFAVMLLFWMLAAYVGTRSLHSLVSAAAIGAAVAASAYLFGQGMQANAATVTEWRDWSRTLVWGAVVAPTLWYVLTVLLLREEALREPVPAQLRTYLRWICYPLAGALSLLALACTAAIYAGDALFRWSAPVALAEAGTRYSRFHLPDGPLHPALLALLFGTTAAAALNVGLGWHWTEDRARRSRFAWLLLSAALFFLAANTLGLGVSDWTIVPSHLALGAAMLAILWNVAAYNLLLKGQGHSARRALLHHLARYGLLHLRRRLPRAGARQLQLPRPGRADGGAHPGRPLARAVRPRTPRPRPPFLRR